MSTARDRLAKPIAGYGLANWYASVRAQTVALTEPLSAEDCVVQTIPEVSPSKWHLAHVTWFFEKFCLREHLPDYRPYDERYDYLFNSYYYTVGKMHPRAARGLLSRPSLQDIFDYRRHVDSAMQQLAATCSAGSDVDFKITLGLHHEQQHQELLLTDIKHVFFTNPLAPAYAPAAKAALASRLEHRFIAHAGGRFAVGSNGSTFCFDNETPRHDVLLDDYAVGNRLVTNSEYREFIDDGGYRQSAHWLADGWASVQERQWARPLYWSEDRQSEFTLHGWREIDPHDPVCHVSFYEADAFARWAGARLPGEHELECLACDTDIDGNTLESGLLHPCGPMTSEESGDRPQQLWGDVWEWTSSPYRPYPRFKPLQGSLGEYNGKFMSNQMVVRGGSCVTTAAHLRASYRSFFYPHDRWQFLGIRLAQDV